MSKQLQIVLLVTFAGALVVSMLVISMLTTRPVAAQTPTPTSVYWRGTCSDWTWYAGGVGGPVSWGTNAFTCSANLKGVINELTGIDTSADLDTRNGGNSPPASWDDPVLLRACGDDQFDPVACTGVGEVRTSNWVSAGACDDGWIDDGGIWQCPAWLCTKPGGWYARVCPIYYSPPPPLPECGLAVITDTHFVSDTWTRTAAAWYWSYYYISAGGSIRKTAAFSATGNYQVSVYAQSTATGTLNVSAGGASVGITIVPTMTFAWYTATVPIASLAPEILAAAAAENPADIVLDRLCINYGGMLTCGVVSDYHFATSFSWSNSAGTWTSHQWQIPYSGWIAQTVNITTSGQYSVTMRARGPGEDPGVTTDVGLIVDGITSGQITGIPGASSWADYATAILLDVGTHEFKVGPTGLVDIDSICVMPVMTSTLGACGVTAADMAVSANYIRNSNFSDGFYIGIPRVGFTAGPLNASFGGDTAFDSDWWLPSFTALNWFNTLVGTAADGALRYRDGGYAVGLIPMPLSNGTYQTFINPVSQSFNVVVRMKRRYGNSHLYVNGQDIGSGNPVGSWTDASAYFDATTNSVELNADCGGAICADPDGDPQLSVVDIDDVYIVPGPQMICGSTAPITTPLGSCINPNPDFELGLEDWHLEGGASIYDGWARLPGGSFIEQDVPAASGTSTWSETSSYINAGYSYAINVKAHLEHQNDPGQFTVIVGASSSGQVSFNHQVVSNPSLDATDSFSATEAMIGTGADPTVRIRIVNESGGTIVIDSVCITYGGGGGGTNPIGQCLGTWETSSGDDAIGVEIIGNDYVSNDQRAMYGSYVLDVAGIAGQDTNTLRVSYYNQDNGMIDSAGILDVVGYAWSGQLVFVVPPGGWYNGALQIVNDNTLTYDNICLRVNGTGPTPVEPNPPETMPYPECGSINSPYTTTAGFYMMNPYSITSEYTGTMPAYVAELTYNYAIYPLVCTTVSIANWQFRAYNDWLLKFQAFADPTLTKLDRIIALLEEILDKIQSPTPPTCGLVDVALWIFKAIFAIFLKILALLIQMIELFIKIFKGMMLDIRGESAVQYPFSCGGDGQWMCFALAGVMSLDQYVGDWLNIIALIVCSMLTVSLVFWVIGQVRGMLQPGTESSDAD